MPQQRLSFVTNAPLSKLPSFFRQFAEQIDGSTVVRVAEWHARSLIEELRGAGYKIAAWRTKPTGEPRGYATASSHIRR